MLFLRRITRYGVFLLFCSCITPYDAKVKESTPRIVVEGLITDQPGPYRVRITRTGAFNNNPDGFTEGVEGATVYATDNLGNRIDFKGFGGGDYLTASNARGVAGRSYKLNIRLADGRTYVSEPDLLRRVPPIDSIYSEYDPAVKKFNVYVDITDSPVPGEGYLWKWTNYESVSICEPSQPIPNTGPPAGQSPCLPCCTRCWNISRCIGCVNIAGDQYVNGNQIKRQPIITVPYDSRGRYYLMVEQRSLSPEAYRFWNAVKLQSGGTAGPFDAPPAPVKGNIANAGDAGEKVLGFFGASGVLFRQYWVMRSGIAENPVIPNPQFCPAETGPPPSCAPCTEQGGSRTTSAPPKWDD